MLSRLTVRYQNKKMSGNGLILFFIFSVLITGSRVTCDDGDVTGRSSIVQLSKQRETPDIRSLKASLNPCKVHHKEVKCTPELDIEVWMVPKDEHETFLLIDEVYDSHERKNFPLLHPYMIQLSTSEQTLMYPLVLNQVVDVSCNEGEVVQRREADNSEALTNEGAECKIAFDLFLSLLIETFFRRRRGSSRFIRCHQNWRQ